MTFLKKRSSLTTAAVALAAAALVATAAFTGSGDARAQSGERNKADRRTSQEGDNGVGEVSPAPAAFEAASPSRVT